jgi:hypothetical protein
LWNDGRPAGQLSTTARSFVIADRISAAFNADRVVFMDRVGTVFGSHSPGLEASEPGEGCRP